MTILNRRSLEIQDDLKSLYLILNSYHSLLFYFYSLPTAGVKNDYFKIELQNRRKVLYILIALHIKKQTFEEG